jgi:type IV secretory pathway VirB10-like protein
MRKRILPLALAVQMLLFSNGCAISRRKPKTPPPPPRAAAAPIPEPKPSEPLIVEPQIPPPVVEIPLPAPQPEAIPPKFPEPPKPKPRRKTVRRPATVVPQPETKPEPPPQPPAPPPRLDEVLGADQRTELLAQLDANVTEARRILGSLSGRSLTREQSEAAARARAFIEQALERKDSDIGTAVALSRRALLLARDLAESAR